MHRRAGGFLLIESFYTALRQGARLTCLWLFSDAPHDILTEPNSFHSRALPGTNGGLFEGRSSFVVSRS